MQLYIQPRVIRTSLRYVRETFVQHFYSSTRALLYGKTKIVQSVQAIRVVPSSGGETASSKQFTSRSAAALLHSSAGRISIKEHISSC